MPPPAGVAQVPSPRQKVDDDADVPLFRLPTGKLPVTSLASLTVSVFDAPLIVLFVSVSVVALPTSVSVAAGSVSVPDAVAEALMVVEPDVDPASRNFVLLKVFAPVTVSALPSVMVVPDAAGPVNVTPSGIVSVEPVAG